MAEVVLTTVVMIGGMLDDWLTDDLAGAVVNVFEAVDVIALIKGGVYDELNMPVGEALLKRSDVSLSPRPHPTNTSRPSPAPQPLRNANKLTSAS